MDLSGIVKVRYGEYKSDDTDTAQETSKEQTKVEQVSEPTKDIKPTIHSLICMELGKRGISDTDTIMKYYIDSKLDAVTLDGVKDYIDSKLGPVEEKVEDSVEEPQQPQEQPQEETETPSRTYTEQETNVIQATLKAKGYDPKVSLYKIKNTIPCIKVELTGYIHGIKDTMSELGYTFKSKYKDSFYFV